MKYPIHNKLAYSLLFATDLLLKPFFPPRPHPKQTPRSLLICNGAHLGDVILTTSLLSPLKNAYPDLKIGMAVGSWAKNIVSFHPLVDHVHFIDHWKLNRSPKQHKFKHYLHTRRQALKEMRALNYEAAIDCRFHYPNMASLLWQARIPLRGGFASAGFGPLLTHALDWDPHEDRSAVEAFFSLLSHFPNVNRFTDKLHPSLGNSASEKKEPYLVLHPGTGDLIKEWPLEKWQELARKLTSDGYVIYCTGQGERENKTIQAICSGLKNCINLCDQLPWEAFVPFIARASLLIGVDSAAGHVASAVGTPAILLFTGIHPPNLWRPTHPNIKVLTNKVPCSPCLKGCNAMSCVKEISIERVYEAIRSFDSNVGFKELYLP